MKLPCPVCGRRLRLAPPRNAASVAVGWLLSSADLYICRNRHVWVWADCPTIAPTEEF